MLSKILRRIAPIIGGIFIMVVLIDLLDLYKTAIGTSLYKICMTIVGFVLAESIWSMGFRPYFGEFENIEFISQSGNYTLAIGIFRGFLYSSIIIACSLGL
jgi:hypothetical protein